MNTNFNSLSVKIPIACFLIIVSLNLFSQDQIYLKNGEKLNGKVEEIGVEEVKYKKRDSPDGPTYVLEKKLVDSVKYANGQTEPYSNLAGANGTFAEFKRNTVSINFIPFIYDQMQFDFRHIFKGGRIGVSVPLVIRLSDDVLNSEYRAKWMTGVELILIPTGQRIVMYNLGIGINTGQFTTIINVPNYYQDPVTGNTRTNWVDETRDHNFFGFSINNSLEYNPTNWLGINVGVNFGFNRVIPNIPPSEYQYYYSEDLFQFFARPEIGVGIKF